MSDSDQDLLGLFARDRTQDAFTTLVKRHVNLVYSAALRQVRSPQLAEEVAQSVFTDLARHADRLANGIGSPPVLMAWLYQVTRHTAIDVVRRESRRQLREQIAVEINAMNATEANWSDIEPLLDEAVAALDETDRAAVLLRYFENQSLRDIGRQLGVSDDAAQKRVSRAVERLREFFAKRGVTVGAGGLVVVISANAVQAAPVGLTVTISAAALAGTAATTSTLIAATTKTIAMTTLQKTLVTATVAVLAGAGIYEARQAAQLRNQVQTLQQQQAPLAEQLQQLQNNFADATNRLAGLRVELANANENNLELMKLRGQIGTLQSNYKKLNEDYSRLQNLLESDTQVEVKPPVASTKQAVSEPVGELVITEWQRGNKTVALKIFLEANWGARPLFGSNSVLNLSEDQFTGLSDADRMKRFTEMTSQLNSLKELAATVANAGREAAARGDSGMAEKYFSALNQCGTALDDQNGLMLVQMAGQALRKMSIAEAAKLK